MNFTSKLRRFFVFLTIAFLNIHAARANGVVEPVQSGSWVYGNVSGAAGSGAIDTYTIANVPANAYIYTALAWTPPAGYADLRYAILRPDGSKAAFCYVDTFYFHSCTAAAGAYSGTWTVEVWRAGGGVTGGDYSLTFGIAPLSTAISVGQGGGAMYPDQTYYGSIVENHYDYYSFQGIAGQNATIYYATTGGTGLGTRLLVIRPTGTIKSNAQTYGSSYVGLYPVDTSGVWTVFVVRADSSTAADTYSISISGAGAALPVDGKADGDCVACRLAHAGGAAAGIP